VFRFDLLSFRSIFKLLSNWQGAGKGVPDFHQSVGEADANLSGCFDHLIAWVDASEVMDSSATLVTPLTAAFSPGQSPPLLNTPIR
jgi:hypothetical protein